MNNKPKNKEVIVIGAGPAGLTAAHEALKAGCSVTVLEASDTFGGISRTVESSGNRMDIGGHRFFTKDQKVSNFWFDLMPLQGKPAWDDKLLNHQKPYAADGPDPETDDQVMLIRRRVSRILYLNHFFDYPISLKFSTFAGMGLKRTIIAGFGYLKSVFFKREEITLKDFMINRFGEPLYRMFFEKYTEKLWGKNPSEIDASWGAQRIKGVSLGKVFANIFKKIVPWKTKTETSLIEEFYYPKKGPGQLWTLLADKVVKMGGCIIKNAEVKEITLDPSGNISHVSAVLDSGDTKIFSGDVFFSSMALKDFFLALKPDSVPQNIYDWGTELPYRDFISVGLEVPKLKLVNRTKMKTVNNIVPDCWIYIQEKDVKIGRLQIFNNWSPYMVRDPQNSVWIGLEYFCDETDLLWNMDEEDFIKMAVEELKSIHVLDQDVNVTHSACVKIKKAYPAYFGTYKHFDSIKQWLNGISNLYCIGRNGQHRYNNMDHSVMTAMEAVKSMLNNSGKENVWAVNTEQEYHEKNDNKK